MAIFGRRSARERLRTAAREALTIPAFSAPADCTSWVLGGLWPAELATISPETAPLADYLNSDLRRIANSANEKLQAIGNSGLVGQARHTAEARVINVARAFAVLRVESTVRQLHKESVEFGAEFGSLGPAPTLVFPVDRGPDRSTSPPSWTLDVGADGPRHRNPETVTDGAHEFLAPDASTGSAPVRRGATEPDAAGYSSAAEHRASVLTPDSAAPPEGPDRADFAVMSFGPEATPPFAPAVADESAEQQRHRWLAFVARQEPGLRWAIGSLPDGNIRLATDIASGWIPPGIQLPAGVQLLDPGRRMETVTEMLGDAEALAVYTPGDRLGWAIDYASTETSVQPRELTSIEDLGWQLSEATHWREGLPRMANTVVKAGSVRTGVSEDEIDLLRVHLDTMRYQLLAQYPDPDAAGVLNCMLLAATEGVATGDLVSANYHYSWFRALSAPPASQWDARTAY